MLQFKSAKTVAPGRSGSGEPSPRPNSLWAVNPPPFMWGWVCWGDGNKILGEKLVSISQPMPDITKLPDKGFPWQQQMGGQLEVHLRHRCRHGGRVQDQRPTAAGRSHRG